jgi:hypothetical protein
MESREAIEWFKNRIYVMPESETKEMFRMAISALEKQEADRWVPVTERLPKSDGKYLVTEQFSNAFPPEVNVLCFATDLNKVKRYVFEKGESGFYRYDDEWGYIKVNNVTAWREKIEPYRSEEEV